MENTRDRTGTMHTQLLHHALHWDLAINQDYIYSNVLQIIDVRMHNNFKAFSSSTTC